MKVGIAGAGTIVPDFLEASSTINELEIIAITGQESDIKTMNQLAQEYRIDDIYTNYEIFLNSNIEIVYIAVPNHLHYQFALKALQKKKHVILEKPFAANYQQAQQLITTANENKVMIFEAISNQYLPNYFKTKDLLKTLGNIKIVQLNYSQYSRRYDLFKQGTILPVFDPQKCGGALMDLNVYNIHFLTGLFGKPSKIQYYANIENGIDTSGILILNYPSFQCISIGAKDCKAPVSINIQGDQGYIHSDEPANAYNQFILEKNNGEKQIYSLNEHKHRLYYELKSFVEILIHKNNSLLKEYNQHTLDVMQILDKARKQVGIKWEEE